MRQTRIACRDSGDERIDHLVLDQVRAVARARRPRVAAPVVLGLLVLGERIGDQAEQAHALAERRADGLGSVLAERPVAVAELVERGGDRERLAAHGDAHTGHRLVEQAYPGGASRDALIVEQALGLVRELVRAEDAQVTQPGRPGHERGVGELGVEFRVLDPVQLEREEDQVGADRRRPLLDGLVEAPDPGVGAVLGEKELGVAHRLAERLLDPLVLADGGGKVCAGKAGELSLVRCLERARGGLGAIERSRHLRAVDTREKVREVPGGKRAERLLFPGLGGGDLGVGQVERRVRHLVRVLHG